MVEEIVIEPKPCFDPAQLTKCDEHKYRDTGLGRRPGGFGIYDINGYYTDFTCDVKFEMKDCTRMIKAKMDHLQE